MRKIIVISAVGLLLIAVLAATLVACGGGSSTTSSTVGLLPGSGTTAPAETTTTAATGETTTTVAGETTTSSEETTTTEAARTTDTADHANDFKSHYPSSESFNDSTWASLASSPASHLGAAVDVKGTAGNVTVDPDSRYLTWELTVTDAAGAQTKALCRTNLNVDRTLLTAGGAVEVKGIVVGAQDFNAGGGPIIYVESITKAS
jgi:hypothetical protein